MLLIGIDLGTSACKLLLMDQGGSILNIVTKEYPLEFPQPGWSQQNPEDWMQAVLAGVPELLRGFDASQVAGIGAGGQMHGLVVLDEEDRVIRPAILWNDGRTQRQVEYLNGPVGRDVLLELLKAELVFFSVQGRTEDGLFSCVNVFTGEDYMLMLPFDDDVKTENVVFMGHIFYNQTMVMNCLRGMQIPKSSFKRFVKVMKQAKDWVSIREQGPFDWGDFIKRYPMFVRHMSLIYSAYVKLDGFNETTTHQHYRPAPRLKDAVSDELWYAMQPYAFSAFDIKLAQQLWSDYVATTGKNVASIRRPEIWAAGVINCFVQANGVYNYKPEHISTMCNGVPMSTITRTTNEIEEKLLLEPHDPRYINEEGLLLMLLM